MQQPLGDTCPICHRRAFLGAIGIEQEGGSIELRAEFFCDRTEGCKTHVFMPQNQIIMHAKDMR